MSTQFAVDLVFKSQTQQLDKVANQIKQFERDISKLQGKNPFEGTERGARDAGRAVNNLERNVKGATGAMNGLVGAAGRVAAALGIAMAAQSAFSAGINRVESERRLTALAGAYGEVGTAQAAAARSAQKFGISQTEANQAFAQTYARLRPIGVSLRDIESAFNGFNTSAKLSGTGAAEASSAWMQLSQALGSGALRGDELNSVFEQTPGVVQAIAKEMGAPIGKMRELAQEGKITADVVLKALRRIETEGADKLSEALGGPQQKIKNFQNAFENAQVAITETIIPELTTSLDELAKLIINLKGPIQGIGRLAANTLGTINDLINAATKPREYAAAQAIRGGRLPMAGLGGIEGANELFKGSSGTSGTGLTGLKKEAEELAKLRRQPVDKVLLELMGNRLKRMDGKSDVLPPATVAAPPQRTTPVEKEVSKSRSRTQGLQGRYIQGGYGPKGPNQYGAHFDIKRTDGSYFPRNALDKYVQVDGRPLSSGLTVAGGEFGASRDGGKRTHNAWDYAFRNRAALSLKGGAKWMGSQGGSYGDTAVFQAPDGKIYRIIHGKFEKNGEAGSSLAGGINDQLAAEDRQMQEEQTRLENLDRLRGANAELLASSNAQIAIAQQLNPLEKERLLTAEAKRKIEAEYAQKSSELAKLGGDAAIAANLEQAKKNELLVKDLELTNKLAEIKENAISGLKEENAQMEAKLAGKEQEYLIEAKIASLKKQGVDPVEATALVQRNEQLKAQVAVLDQVKAQWQSLAQTIESELSSAMSNAITSLVEGTQTAEQAFSQMFKNIGKAFIDMATQMIAKALIMKVLGILGGGSSGGGIVAGNGGAGFSQAFAGAGGIGSSGFSLFADGGYVTGPTRALIGEAGESEYVIPSSKMGNALANYGAGKRGAGVLDGGDGGGGGGAGNGGSIDISYSVTEINSMRFVTEEQFTVGMAAAVKQGAAGGHARVMGDLRNKRSTRSRLGM